MRGYAARQCPRMQNEAVGAVGSGDQPLGKPARVRPSSCLTKCPAQTAASFQPQVEGDELPVVYVTGDSANAWASQGVPNSVLITKPFAPAQVVTAVSLNAVSSAPPSAV